jgi:polar amino acid transport system substrate-binding protein
VQDKDTGEEIRPRWLVETAAAASPASSLDVCFKRLAAGEVDAVAADEFRGILALFRLGLTETIVPLSDPVGVDALHVSVPKTHWRATAHLYRLNAGLAALRRSGAYAEIVARHTQGFWARLKNLSGAIVALSKPAAVIKRKSFGIAGGRS